MGICANSKHINLSVGGIAKDNKIIYTKSKLGPFAKAILKNSVLHEGNPSFFNIVTTDEGLWSLPDDYGLSYYFRGAVENNYVKFANRFWRIIRINGDGSIRIIYDGTVAHKNAGGKSTFETTGIDGRKNSSDRFNKTGVKYNNSSNSPAYVGYMYGRLRTSKAECQANEINSNIKNVVDSIYESLIKDTIYEKYIADEIFYNDRKVISGDGYSSSAITYFNGNQKTKPQFTCENKNDAFTVNDTVKGNGALTYPVGLITMDELIAAGCTTGDVNIYSYLYKSSEYDIRTMTPVSFRAGSAQTAILNIGMIDKAPSVDGTNTGYSVAIVINIKPNSKVTGTGTATDPYTIVGVE